MSLNPENMAQEALIGQPIPTELGEWLTAIGELYEAMGRPKFDAQTPTLGVLQTLREAARRLAAEKTQPLEDEQIDEGRDEWLSGVGGHGSGFAAGVRFAERAHGIGALEGVADAR